MFIVTAIGNSVDKLRQQSDAYSAAHVLLNKQQIWCGGANLHCYCAICAYWTIRRQTNSRSVEVNSRTSQLTDSEFFKIVELLHYSCTVNPDPNLITIAY